MTEASQDRRTSDGRYTDPSPILANRSRRSSYTLPGGGGAPRIVAAQRGTAAGSHEARKNAPSVPAFADVARFVAGSDAPPWLAAHFKRWAPSLKVDRFVQEMQPTKAEMKKWLAEVRDAALLLRDALNDTPIREFLEIAPLGPIEFRGVFDQMVQELAGRAERAMASTLLSADLAEWLDKRTKILLERERIKRATIQNRRLQHQLNAHIKSVVR
jgi:hypothetical protein